MPVVWVLIFLGLTALFAMLISAVLFASDIISLLFHEKVMYVNWLFTFGCFILAGIIVIFKAIRMC